MYGLTELHRDEVAGRTSWPTPCYPTAALLAVAPLKQLGLADVIIDAKSGVSGAGKTPKSTTHFCSVDSDLLDRRAVAPALCRRSPRASPPLPPTGTARRRAGRDGARRRPGAVAHLRAAPRAAAARHQRDHLREDEHAAAAERRRATALYDEFYAGETFVEVAGAPPALKDVAGTNCRIFPHVDAPAGLIVVISVIDNLMKGASGQAVQNMNVMLGLPEHEGLV